MQRRTYVFMFGRHVRRVCLLNEERKRERNRLSNSIWWLFHQICDKKLAKHKKSVDDNAWFTRINSLAVQKAPICSTSEYRSKHKAKREIKTGRENFIGIVRSQIKVWRIKLSTCGRHFASENNFNVLIFDWIFMALQRKVLRRCFVILNVLNVVLSMLSLCRDSSEGTVDILANLRKQKVCWLDWHHSSSRSLR